MEFVCIGFDVRDWPWPGPFNADETGWSKCEEAYNDIRDALALKENEYQLLEMVDKRVLAEAIALVAGRGDCNLMALELPRDVVELNDMRHGYRTGTTSLKPLPLLCRGYDVCDFNGLFSVLCHPDLAKRRGTVDLIPLDRQDVALELAQYANVLDPSHSPFVVTRVSVLKS